jgi:hypothetical protein
MKKLIKQYGTATVLRFSKEEKEIYGIEPGKVVEFTIHKVTDNGTE